LNLHINEMLKKSLTFFPLNENFAMNFSATGVAAAVMPAVTKTVQFWTAGHVRLDHCREEEGCRVLRECAG
jgi:hypothetical protein